MTTDYKKELVEALDTILPTYYELVVDSTTPTPCITYRTYSDVADRESLNIGMRYSRPAYQIKIWGNRIADLGEYAQQVDDLLFEIGWQRIGYQELTYNNQIQLVMTYQALFLETQNI